jgi:tyrosyl-DNA phosphodiesterase-1
MFHLIYPSESFVHSAKNPSQHEPYFLQADFMDGFRFEESILTHYQPKDPKVAKHLYHVKMFVTTFDSKITDDSTIYIGSHNFTKQAWGKILERTGRFQVNNTELGVLMGPMKNSQEQKSLIVQSLNFKIPARKYTQNDLPYTLKRN